MAWMPFGQGPRSCIAMRLALMEVKFAMVHLVKNFKIVTCAETQVRKHLILWSTMSRLKCESFSHNKCMKKLRSNTEMLQQSIESIVLRALLKNSHPEKLFIAPITNTVTIIVTIFN